MSRTFSWVRRPVQPIALDLGTRFVRMLQVAHIKGQTTATACAQYEIPPGVYSPVELDEIHVRAVRSMLATGKFLGREVISALSWDQLQLRNVRIPPMPAEDIAAAVRFEAADRLGLDEDKGEVRFIVAGDVRQGTEVRQEVIVLAADRAVIDGHIKLLGRMGLQAAALDAAPCAMFRGFERFLRRGEDQNDANVFVDLGYGGTRVVMSRGPDITFVKAIPIGGRRFDELVAESLSMTPHDAVQLRYRLLRGQLDGSPPTSEGADDNTRRAVLNAIRPALEQLSKELALCVRYGSVTFRGPRAETITVIGGEASNADILQVLTDQVRVPLHPGKPLRNITLEAELQGIDRRHGQPEWATAVGLAIKPRENEPNPQNRTAAPVEASS